MTCSLQDTPELGNHKHDSARNQCCMKVLPRKPWWAWSKSIVSCCEGQQPGCCDQGWVGVCWLGCFSGQIATDPLAQSVPPYLETAT